MKACGGCGARTHRTRYHSNFRDYPSWRTPYPLLPLSEFGANDDIEVTKASWREGWESAGGARRGLIHLDGNGGNRMRIKLPEPVAAIYKAVEELTAAYPGRKFTPDGHLVGSIGEVVAAEALGLTLYPASHPGHDAYDANGDVQIKMTGGGSISLYATCDRLVVLKVVSPTEAEIVYDGPGEPVWTAAGKMQKNGQRPISLSRLRMIASSARDARIAEPA